MRRKYLQEMIPLSEKHLNDLMHKTGISEKHLLLLLLDARRTGEVVVFTIADREWPRNRC